MTTKHTCAAIMRSIVTRLHTALLMELFVDDATETKSVEFLKLSPNPGNWQYSLTVKQNWEEYVFAYAVEDTDPDFWTLRMRFQLNYFDSPSHEDRDVVGSMFMRKHDSVAPADAGTIYELALKFLYNQKFPKVLPQDAG